MCKCVFCHKENIVPDNTIWMLMKCWTDSGEEKAVNVEIAEQKRKGIKVLYD